MDPSASGPQKVLGMVLTVTPAHIGDRVPTGDPGGAFDPAQQ